MTRAQTIVRAQPTRSVQFVCPKCGGDRDGTVLQRRSWVAAFGMPVVPLADIDDAVRCDTCAYTSDLGVLDIPTTQQLECILFEATVAATVLLVRATSGDHRAEVNVRALGAINAAGFSTSNRELANAVAVLSGADATMQLRRLRRDLTQFGKQGFLHRMSNIVTTDCSITPAQRDALQDIGNAIGLATAHIHGIIAVASVHAAA